MINEMQGRLDEEARNYLYSIFKNITGDIHTANEEVQSAYKKAERCKRRLTNFKSLTVEDVILNTSSSDRNGYASCTFLLTKEGNRKLTEGIK